MSQNETSCKQCGKCCHFEIPLTLLDIYHIAQYLYIEHKEVFKEYIQQESSHKSGLFKVSKRENSACIFLSRDKKCSVHEVKPLCCHFYLCTKDSAEDIIPWTVSCTNLSEQAKIWEQSIASMITREYIKKNGTLWNEADYFKSILSIRDNVVTDDKQKIKLARDKTNSPIALIYNCSECEKRGKCCKETPITLDDIRRIISHLNISWENFFKNKIASSISIISGSLLLKRNESCIFFNQQKHCTIGKVRPMHCRFTPCPQKTSNNEMFDCLFLGSGTIENQFRHQVSLAVTREYASIYGPKYNKKGIKEKLKTIDLIISSQTNLDEFCKRISSYRYINDTLLLKKKPKT